MVQGKTSLLVLAVVLAFLVAGLAAGQSSKSVTPDKKQTNKTRPQSERQKSAKEEREKLWLERAERLTEEIRDEEWRLREQRPLLLARLAEAWWKVDIKRARPWMDSAVGALEFQPQNESVADARKRLATAQSVLKIALKLDKSYADRLVGLVLRGVEQAADHVTNAEDRRELSRLISDLGRVSNVAAGNANLDSASRISRVLMKLRAGNEMQSVIPSIRVRDATRGDQLFAEALESARLDYDAGFLFGLGQVAYPTFARSPEELPAPELREAFLKLLAEGFLRIPQDEQERHNVCTLSSEAVRLINNYAPEQMGPMQSAIDGCNSSSPAFRSQSAIARGKLETAEEFLKAAEAESDPHVSTYYKQLAAEKAADGGDNLRAVEIFDGYTEQERQADPGMITTRANYELEAIEQLYKRRDFQTLQRLFDKSPQPPRTLLTAAEVVLAEKDESFGMLLLAESRRSLEKNFVDEPYFYVRFFNAYAKAIPSETAAVFKESLFGLRQIKGPEPDAKFWYAPLSFELRVLPLPPQVLELDPQYLTASIKTLDSAQDRTTLRLSLLRLALQRYEQEKKQSDQQRRVAAPAKGKGRDNVAPTDH